MFCSFVFTKLKVSSFKFNFYFICVLPTKQARRSRQNSGEEAGLNCKTSQSLLESDIAQVTAPVPQLSLV